MINKQDIKLWWRSGSWTFVRNKKTPGQIAQYRYHGQPIRYRTGSSDMTLIHDILLYRGPKAEYWLPKVIDPRTVLDIGGNIGLAAVYFARRWPEADIFTVEPLPENYELLRQNVAPYTTIHPYRLALGTESGRMTMHRSVLETNYGGASMYHVEVNHHDSVVVDVERVHDFFIRHDLTAVDLIKIDTEGAEYDILSSLPKDILFRTKWIIGELHGINDFKLLDLLAPAFAVDVRKTLHKQYFRFNACRKDLLERIPRQEIRWLQY
jgi:FkbM family methyltransferase